VLNVVPSRLTGLLTVAAAPIAGGTRAETLRVWRRDRNDHPSPNAGQCESAMAGALGVRLGGRNVYFGRTETRPFLGDGPRPSAAHIRRAARLSAAVGLGAAALAAAVAAGRGAGLAAARSATPASHATSAEAASPTMCAEIAPMGATEAHAGRSSAAYRVVPVSAFSSGAVRSLRSEASR
jgi:adenosylcobinamide-phosphate synthase